MEFATPRLILSVDFPDANALLAGVLSLKGFKVLKSKSTNECLSLVNQSEKVDVILIDKESAIANNSLLLNEINKIAPDIMIVVIVDNDDDIRKLPKNLVECVLRPTTAENLADKVLNMLAKKELKRIKDTCRPEYEINF